MTWLEPPVWSRNHTVSQVQSETEGSASCRGHSGRQPRGAHPALGPALRTGPNRGAGGAGPGDEGIAPSKGQSANTEAPGAGAPGPRPSWSSHLLTHRNHFRAGSRRQAPRETTMPPGQLRTLRQDLNIHCRGGSPSDPQGPPPSGTWGPRAGCPFRPSQCHRLPGRDPTCPPRPPGPHPVWSRRQPPGAPWPLHGPRPEPGSGCPRP